MTPFMRPFMRRGALMGLCVGSCLGGAVAFTYGGGPLAWTLLFCAIGIAILLAEK